MRALTFPLATVVGLGMAAVGAVVPSLASNAQADMASGGSGGVVAAAGFTGHGVDHHRSSQFVNSVRHLAEVKQAAQPGLQTVTLTYNDSDAPSFQNEIARSTEIWNNSVDNVTLQETSGAGDFSYDEGYGSGSYESGGYYIFLDLGQAQKFAPTRIVAHETGHILGLDDDYDGPCSELMSGGGAGTDCTNPYPDAWESARVDELWG